MFSGGSKKNFGKKRVNYEQLNAKSKQPGLRRVFDLYFYFT